MNFYILFMILHVLYILYNLFQFLDEPSDSEFLFLKKVGWGMLLKKPSNAAYMKITRVYK